MDNIAAIFKGIVKPVNRLARVLLVLALGLLALTDTNGQTLVGSPGSQQSAVQKCVPASYWILYRFEVDGGVVPTGYFRILFRLLDDGGNVVKQQSYVKDDVSNDVNVAQSPDPPFNWVISKSHLFELPPSLYVSIRPL
jgi:hypothetical protein